MASTNTIILSEWDDYSGASNAGPVEVYHVQHSANFPALTGANVTVSFSAAVIANGALPYGGTLRIRTGGTLGNLDGTVLHEVSVVDAQVLDVTAGWYPALSGSAADAVYSKTFTMARPTTPARLTFSCDGDADGKFVYVRIVCIIRGDA